MFPSYEKGMHTRITIPQANQNRTKLKERRLSANLSISLTQFTVLKKIFRHCLEQNVKAKTVQSNSLEL